MSILINAETGATEDVQITLKKIPEIKETHILYGVFDIIVKVEAESLVKLKNILSEHIRRIDKIRSTYTMICLAE